MMSKNDTFPFWSDEWMKSQQEYLDSWTAMSEKMAGAFQPPRKPRNPWIEALEQWEAFVPNTGEAQPYVQRMLNQGKAFFQMSDEISTFLKLLDDVNKSTDQWQQSLRQQMDEVKKAFESGQGDLAAFWNQPLSAWKNVMDDPSLRPDVFLKGFDPKQGIDGMIDPLLEEVNKLLSAPGVGPDRETHDQQKKYTRLWLDYQRAMHEYNTAHQRVGGETIERLMQKMITLAEDDKSLDSVRAVYDLWVDCAEDAYADFAYSAEYQEVYGRMINSLMALKNEFLNMIDETSSAMGLPSRKGFDTVLKRMQEMRREIRKLQSSQTTNTAGNKGNTDIAALRAEINVLRKEVAELKKTASSSSAVSTAAITKKKVVRKKTAASKSTK